MSTSTSTSTSGQQQWTSTPREEFRQLVEINARKICLPEVSNINTLADFPSYGPLQASREGQFFKDLKEQAWNRLITDFDVEDKDEYIHGVRSILPDARASYMDFQLSDNDFLVMMVKDSCWFLLLVLWGLLDIPLGYPPEHAVFGSTRDEKKLRMWIASMFIVGNQIPLVVLSKLMCLRFFQVAIRSIITLKKPVGMMEKVLHEFLFSSELLSSNQQGSRAVDLLHGLHLMMVLGRRLVESIERQEVTISVLGPLSIPYNGPLLRSAKELRQAGICFKGVDGMGIREIHFKRNMFKGVLYLPIYIIDEELELLFKSLKAYEMVDQHLFRIHEVCSFFRFLSELVRTKEDVEILAAEGVIKGETRKLVGILCRLDCGRVDLSANLHDVVQEIDHYSRPRYQKFKRIFKYCFTAGTGAGMLVTVVYTALQYYKKND